MQGWRDDRGGEAGASLIEAVIAVFILATAIVALIGGLATSIVATDSQRKNVTSDGVVRSWADKLRNPQVVAYVPCPPDAIPQSYQPPAANVTVPSGFTATLVKVEYWDGSQTASYGACPADGDKGVQRITLAVRANDGRGGARLQLVKRR